MLTYIIRRLTISLLVLLIVTLLIFLIMRLLPGDPVLLFISQDKFALITQEELAAARHEFGVDKPLFVQYLNWLRGLLAGDLGNSIFTGTPVTQEIARALPVSLFLGGLAFVFSHLIGIPAGIICAIRRGKWIDTILTVIANIGITAPSFWVAVILIYLFGYTLHWLPIYGYTSPMEDLAVSLKRAVLPVFCLSLGVLSGCVRQTRSAMLEVIRQDYIRTAWAKGLHERTIIIRHAIRNGIIPVVTLAGMSIPMILGGAVLIENVFNIQGMGRLATEALFKRDYAITQGVALLMAVAVILSNLLVDVSYGWLDPKVRYD